MPLLNTNPTTTAVWKLLEENFKETKELQLKDLFAADKERATKFTLRFQEFIVDYSKNRITDKTLSLLLQLAEEVNLKDAIEKVFNGDPINQTEGRAVLHTALRAKKTETVMVSGVNIIPEVYRIKEQLRQFSEDVRLDYFNFISPQKAQLDCIEFPVKPDEELLTLN